MELLKLAFLAFLTKKACTMEKQADLHTSDAHLQQQVEKWVRSTEHASDQNEKKWGTEETDVASRSEDEKENVPAADIKTPDVSLSSDGYAKFTSAETLIGQDGPCIVYKIISSSIENMTRVTSIDVHTSEPWIVMGDKGGNVCIWDYQKQETVMKKLVTEKPSGIVSKIIQKGTKYIKEKAEKHWVCSVNFFRKKNWLVAGDGGGYIHVYDYTNTAVVKEFKAHDNGDSVDSLALHPTKGYLLSSSAYGNKIILWDWSSYDWKKMHEFDVKSTYPEGVLSLKFNPRDSNTFACVTDDKRLMVGNIIERYSPITKRRKGVYKADYFFNRTDQHLMVTLSSSSHKAEIWDLETGEVVGTLGVSGRRMTHVIGHPTLPILVTALDNGTVCFWDANTYRRLENEIRITDECADDLTLVTDANGITRLPFTSKANIAIMEVPY